MCEATLLVRQKGIPQPHGLAQGRPRVIHSGDLEIDDPGLRPAKNPIQHGKRGRAWPATEIQDGESVLHSRDSRHFLQQHLNFRKIQREKVRRIAGHQIRIVEVARIQAVARLGKKRREPGYRPDKGRGACTDCRTGPRLEDSKRTGGEPIGLPPVEGLHVLV